MKVIGLTGPSGSGKGTAGLLLKKHGIPAIDTDRLYRKILIPPPPPCELKYPVTPSSGLTAA